MTELTVGNLSSSSTGHSGNVCSRPCLLTLTAVDYICVLARGASVSSLSASLIRSKEIDDEKPPGAPVVRATSAGTGDGVPTVGHVVPRCTGHRKRRDDGLECADSDVWRSGPIGRDRTCAPEVEPSLLNVRCANLLPGVSPICTNCGSIFSGDTKCRRSGCAALWCLSRRLHCLRW